MGDGGSDRRGSAGSVIGWDTDLEIIGSFLGRAAIDGGALLMSGDAGMGKTLLLEIAAARAVASGTRVVYEVGAEFEADLSFAGLHQVLSPLSGIAAAGPCPPPGADGCPWAWMMGRRQASS